MRILIEVLIFIAALFTVGIGILLLTDYPIIGVILTVFGILDLIGTALLTYWADQNSIRLLELQEERAKARATLPKVDDSSFIATALAEANRTGRPVMFSLSPVGTIDPDALRDPVGDVQESEEMVNPTEDDPLEGVECVLCHDEILHRGSFEECPQGGYWHNRCRDIWRQVPAGERRSTLLAEREGSKNDEQPR